MTLKAKSELRGCSPFSFITFLFLVRSIRQEESQDSNGTISCGIPELPIPGSSHLALGIP
jgi:hypothetical protein